MGQFMKGVLTVALMPLMLPAFVVGFLAWVAWTCAHAAFIVADAYFSDPK